MQEIEVTIVNWERYQRSRKDVERPHWFKLKNTMWQDQQFFRFTPEERWVWVCLLSYASEKCSATLIIDVDWFCDRSGVDEKAFLNSIDKLSRNGCVTSTLRPRATEERRGEENRGDKKKKEHEKKSKQTALQAAASDTVQLPIKSYYEAYKEKYGVSIRLTGKDIGIIKRLAVAMGSEKLSELLQVYLQLNTKWFETKHHDLVTFEQNLAEVQVALGTGKTTEQREDDKRWEKFRKDAENGIS